MLFGLFFGGCSSALFFWRVLLLGLVFLYTASYFVKDVCIVEVSAWISVYIFEDWSTEQGTSVYLPGAFGELPLHLHPRTSFAASDEEYSALLFPPYIALFPIPMSIYISFPFPFAANAVRGCSVIPAASLHILKLLSRISPHTAAVQRIGCEHMV